MPGIKTATRSLDPWQQLYDSEHAERTAARKMHLLLDGGVLKAQKALKHKTSRTLEDYQKAGKQRRRLDAYTHQDPDEENHEKVRLWLASANISFSSSSSSESSSPTGLEESYTQQEERLNETPMSQIANMLGAIMTLSPVQNQPVPDRTPKFTAQGITLTQKCVHLWTKLVSDCEIKRILIRCKYIQIYQLSSSWCTHTYSRTLICNEYVLYSNAVVNLGSSSARLESTRFETLLVFIRAAVAYLSYSMVFFRELHYCLD